MTAKPSYEELERRVHELESLMVKNITDDLSLKDGLPELADAVDIPTIQSLMDHFFSLTNIGVAILDLKGTILVATGWQDICTRFHRVHPETCKNCLESDLILSNGVEPGTFKLYQCKNHMWDMATPIMAGNRKVGNLFLGQFLFEDELPDIKAFRNQARQYGFDEDEYISALENVPRWTRETVNEVMEFYTKLANLISDLGYKNLLLNESEALLSRSQEISHTGSWKLDLATNRLTWSDEVYRIFGYDLQEFAVNYEAFLDAVHPDDREMVNTAYSDSIQEGRDEYEIQHRIVRPKTGKIRTVIERCIYERDEAGTIVRSVGMIQDITERKRMEEALREKTRCLQNIIDTTSDLVSVTDMEGNFKFIGSSHRILGYDQDSLVGRNVMELVHSDDYQEVATAFAEFLANREDGRKVEYRYLRADGNYIWLETVGKFILDDAGNPKEILFTSRDFTARKRAEGELKRIEWMLSRKPISNKVALTEPHDQGYGDLTELNRDGVILKSIGHERLKSFANDYLELLGTSSAIYEIHGDYAFGIFASGWCRMMDRASRTLCSTPDNVEALNSGRWLCHESCWTDCSKEAIARRGPVDIECNGGIRLYAVPIFAGGNVIGAINFGYGDPPKDPEKVKRLADVFNLKYDDLLCEATAYDSRPPYIIEMAKKRLSSTAKLIGSMVESTQAMEALRESDNQINSIFRSAPVGIGSVVNRVLSKVNIRLCEMTGYDETELIGQSPRMLYPSDEDFEFVDREKYAQIANHGTGTVETRWQKKDGAIMHVLLSSTPVNLKDKSKGVTFTALDITERKQAEMALKESEERFRTLMENIDAVAVQGYGPDGTTQYWNKASERLYGYSQQEAIGRNLLDLIIPSEMKGAVVEEMREMAESGQPIPSGEMLLMHKDGSRVPVISHHAIVSVPGREQELFCLDVDITERKQAEEERENLRKQLNQAQKMESVGRLAGGVAHDFNNMLGVILGHTELALLQADENHDLHADLKEIQKAAKRSADTTRQLLAFARKETISPRKLDLNDTVESMLNMLRRLIGEDIDLVWHPATHLWPVKMDPSQIDQILANLCINAKDAIDGVGKLTIETGRKTFDEAYCKEHTGFIPGDFVLLAVSDNGCGMDKDTLDNLFEPFFTTKEVGKGTGLGLATLYGIVKQNSGFINVYSEPGQGSTFKVYMPRLVADEDIDKAVPEKKAAAGGTETILLVEDEPTILRMTRMMLERKGYSILPAATPGEAIDLANTHAGNIHLLMTDVVMPEMNGRDLAGQITDLYPDIRLLFMSGYTANVIAHQGVLDDGVAFIQKPFSMADMTEKVRELLDTASDKN
ncbi:MAG: PAS domain S-box protein [Desulfotignum sp.]|nr:PAS domain S-box protein [Desulfotignum sp.]